MSGWQPELAATAPRAQRRQLLPWLLIALALAFTVVALRYQGRLWICACGRVDLWAGNTKSADNSQHLADPYSFTHLLHGLLFYGALVWALPRLPITWRLAIAVVVEALWEVVENSAFVIQRYREATLALGYEGDTIVNSLADIVWMVAGFWLARRLGLRRSALLFVATELVLVLWIRDSLVLNIIMLLVPIDALKAWQVGG
jgi:hypothetical protein